MNCANTSPLGKVLATYTRHDEPRLIQRDAAAFIGCTPEWLRVLNSRSKGPPSVRVGRFRYYRVRDLEAFKAAEPAPAAPEARPRAALIVSHLAEEHRFTQAEAAEYLGRSRRWLQLQHREGRGPVSIKSGRTRYYSRTALDSFRAEMESRP